MITACHVPRELDAALAFLQEHHARALVVAGGTNVAGQLRHATHNWEHLLDIGQLQELRGITDLGRGRLRIGALTTCTQLATSSAIATNAPIIRRAALNVGGPQIRNVATIGGNISVRSPGSDLVPALLVLDGIVTLRSYPGTRRIALCEHLEEAPRYDELLVSIDCSAAPNGTALLRLDPRRSLAPAIVSVAIRLCPAAGDRRWQDARIALGGVASTGVRARTAEARLAAACGESLTEAARVTGDAAMEDATPQSDAWASKRYRRHVVGVLTRRAVVEAGQQPRTA